MYYVFNCNRHGCRLVAAMLNNPKFKRLRIQQWYQQFHCLKESTSDSITAFVVAKNNLASTCRYLWMCQDACLPSLTLSTVVCATPAMSPPQNTHGSLVTIVSVSTSGVPHLFSFTGDMASSTRTNHRLQSRSHFKTIKIICLKKTTCTIICHVYSSNISFYLFQLQEGSFIKF